MFNFNFTSVYQGEISISVLSIEGREIKNLKFQKQDIECIQQIDLSNQATGTYLIQLQVDEFHLEQAIVINN